jgi:hypothetical protein
MEGGNRCGNETLKEIKGGLVSDFLKTKSMKRFIAVLSRTTSAQTIARLMRCVHSLQKQVASHRYSTARGSFIAAARTSLLRSRSAAPATRNLSTRWRSKTKSSASCITTTSHHSRLVRLAAWAASTAAQLATARSHKKHSKQ